MDPIEMEPPFFASKLDCATNDCGRYYVCRDCRPEEWKDIEYAEEWYELGATPEQAAAWEMDPMTAEEWIDAGLGAYEAHHFDDLSIDVDEAQEWHNMGTDGTALAEACFWLRGHGFDPHDALGALVPWVEAGSCLYDEEVYLYIAAGVKPHEREGWYKEALELMAGLLRPTRLSSASPTLR